MEIPYISSEYTGGTTVQGFAEAKSLLNNPSEDGNARFLCRVLSGRENGTPQGSAWGIANITANLDTLSVVVQPPVGLTQRGASINAPIGTVFIRRMNAGGGENPNIIVGDAYPEPTPDILITPPEVTVMVDATASGDIGIITVFPLVGPALAFFPTITVNPVAGQAVGYTSDAVYVEVDIGIIYLSPVNAYMKPTRFMQLKAVVNLTETAEAVIDPVENYTARADSVERVTAVVRG